MLKRYVHFFGISCFKKQFTQISNEKIVEVVPSVDISNALNTHKTKSIAFRLDQFKKQRLLKNAE